MGGTNRRWVRNKYLRVNNKLFKLKKVVLEKEVYIQSESDYRKALLVGICAFIMFSLSSIYMLLSSVLWNDSQLAPFFIVGIVGGGITYTLNKLSYFEGAKHLLLLVAVGMIFVFITNSDSKFGVHLYLFCVTVGAIFLFGFKKKRAWLTYSVLALACYSIAEFSSITPVPISGTKDVNVGFELIYFINFLFSSLIITLIIFFQSKLQYKSEEILIKKDLALKESEERFRLAVEGTNAGIWDWENINKDQQWWSPKLYELLGYKPQEITPNKVTFKNLLAEESDYPRLVKDFQKHLVDKKPFSVEYKFKIKDGSYRWFQGSGQAKWNKGERPLRMVGSLVDITEKKNREDEIREKNQLLERTNAELDRFVYSVSHDLRAPLNSIQGLINIGETTNDIAELKPLMGLMSNRVKKLYGFIDDVISFAKNTRTEIQKEEIELKSFLEVIISNSKFRDHASTIDFQLVVSDGLKLSSDSSRLAVVLNNLVDNAIKYHRHEFDRKYIKISAGQSSGDILLEVEDNGQGIPQQAQDRIFDMFFRASDNSNGSGLGLYIVKDMVERIGGNVYLSSKYGEGTTFVIRLPQS